MSQKAAKILEFTPKKRMGQKQREELILSYMSVVKIVAKKIFLKLPANYELDDLVSCGVMGLMDAIEKYDPKKEVKFKTYAEYRIRGQILDALRSSDWASRATRDKIKNVEKVSCELMAKLGRRASDSELCDALNLNHQDFFQLMKRIQPVSTCSLTLVGNGGAWDLKREEITDEGHFANPESITEKAVYWRRLKEIVCELPEKEAKVLLLYYFEDKTMKEISEVLNVTESRVSQLHHTSVKKLQKRVEESELEAA